MNSAAKSNRARPGIVVMGVTGSGKSTLGVALARTMGVPFIDGDDLHSEHNVEKMRRGEPLDDNDRAPWLDAVAAVLAAADRYPKGLVIACSALKLAYRERIRAGAPGTHFVFLDADPALIERRLRGRKGHFMPRSLIASQFDTLERPTARETDVTPVSAAMPCADAVHAILRGLQSDY